MILPGKYNTLLDMILPGKYTLQDGKQTSKRYFSRVSEVFESNYKIREALMADGKS